MAERIPLVARRREVLGKHVRHLRRDGILPGNIFGKGLESVAVQLDAREFGKTLKSHGTRPLFDLTVEGEAAPRPVVLRGLNRSGGTGEPLHVDFYQVDPRTPIQTSVPLHLTGVSPAVRDLAGTLVHGVESLHIRCLPLELPDAITADISRLVSFDSVLHVGDLTPPAGVEILNDPAVVIATVQPPRLRLEGEAEAEPEPEAAT